MTLNFILIVNSKFFLYISMLKYKIEEEVTFNI